MSKRPKLLWIALTSCILLFAACGGCGLLLYRLAAGASHLKSEAIAYNREALSSICRSWDANATYERASPAMRSVDSLDSLKSTLTVFRNRLGSLKKIESCTLDTYSTNMDQDGLVSFATLSSRCEFEKAPGTVKLRLRKTNDRWQIDGFSFTSKALMPSD